jgi:hypothetical protein
MEGRRKSKRRESRGYGVGQDVAFGDGMASIFFADVKN